MKLIDFSALIPAIARCS